MILRLLRRFDALRLFALLLLVLPLVVLLGAGIAWLWQQGALWYWLAALVLCAALGAGLQKLLLKRERALLEDIGLDPNPDWPPSAEVVWQRVDALAESLQTEDWPLGDGERWLELGRRSLDLVARSYHPEVERPVLEMTLPHLLRIIERASHDLRHDIVEHVPFSHRITLGDLLRAQGFKQTAERWFNWYRVGRAVLNPLDALISETWGKLREQGFEAARGELHRWLLRAYVRRVGYYAIDLYSGQLLLDDERPADAPTQQSNRDLERSEQQTTEDAKEPLRILVLGRSNAGKSSLINALFGQLSSAVDVLPGTTRGFTPYLLERDGLLQALVLDAPGSDGLEFDEAALLREGEAADLILWVTPATRPDRQAERAQLDLLRTALAERPSRRPPQWLVVLSHIDQLRPAGQWQPPYDLNDSTNAKARNIRAATLAVAGDLDVALERVVPVCLAAGREYNLDVLWSVLLEVQDEALRARLLRCMEARKREENWALLRRQLGGAGRWLRSLPGR